MDVAIEKKNSLKPIEFNPEKLFGKKILKKNSTTKLTKETIEAKLTAAETRRKVSCRVVDSLFKYFIC